MSPAERPREAAVLVAKIARCRRRLTVVRVVRYGCVACAAALLSAEAVAMGRPAHLPLEIEQIAAGLFAAAIVVAVVCGLLRRPTISQTAAALDARLGLQDRVLTAVQFHPHPDPFSRLVVRDAGERLAEVEPAVIFPIEIPRLARALTVMAVAAPIVFALATGVLRPMRLPSAAGNGVMIAETEERSAPTIESRDEPPKASSRAAVIAGSQSGAADSTAAGTRQGTDASQARPATSSERSLENRPEDSTAGRTAALGRGALRPEAPTGPGIGTGSARVGGAPAGATTDAGGNGGALVPGSGATRSVAAATALRSTAAYRAGWSKGEAAISQDEVPTSRRASVKRYFLAIRPSERQ